MNAALRAGELMERVDPSPADNGRSGARSIVSSCRGDGMGKLPALSLGCTLAAAALFQPASMGPPRAAKAADTPASDKTKAIS